MKITVAMKNQIRAHVLRTAYAEEAEALREEEAQLAERMRVAWNGGEAVCKKMDSLPGHFFPMRQSMTGTNFYSAHRLCLRESARYTALPHEDFDWKVQFARLIDAFEAKQFALRNKRDALAEKTVRAIDCYSTTQAALKDFPEFADFLPIDSVRHLPAIPVRETRDLLCVAGVVTCEESS